MIRCAGVRKSYELAGGRRVEALRGLDLSIEDPGLYGIMGASGSGKSTLLHLLAALDKPDSGEIHVSGRALHTLGEREATLFRRRELGIVFQQFNLIPTLTAQENVELPGMLAGEDAASLRQRSVALLDKLGLVGRGEHRPDALSGGEQQRVAIARALLFAPRVVLADEPTGNLDSANSAILWSLLRDLARDAAATIVMVTHEPAGAAHCKRTFILRDGINIGTLETENLDASGVAAGYQRLVREGA